MAQVELTRTYVIYQAQTKLLELATEIAEARNVNKPEIKEKLILNTKIRLWLKALQYYTYLEKSAIDKLVYCLADLCDANALPYSPQITTVEQPDLIIGGSTSVTNVTSSDSTAFSNLTVTSPSEVIDSFAYTLSNGVRWEYNIRTATTMRKGSFSTGWLSDGSDIDDGVDISTAEIGDTSPVVLSCDISGGNVRLIATVSSGTWTISGKRYLD